MPKKAALEARATAVLGTPGSPEYVKAQGIVSGAATLTDAVVTDPFFLGPLSAAAKTEIQGMLALLPPGDAAAILGHLQNALAANARVVFVWNQHPTGGFDHSSVINGGVAFVEIRTPPGD
jgi:hypothetical protein